MPGLNDVPDLFDHALTGYPLKGGFFPLADRVVSQE